MTEHTPVLIVGAGPVGLALAGDLAARRSTCSAAVSPSSVWAGMRRAARAYVQRRRTPLFHWM